MKKKKVFEILLYILIFIAILSIVLLKPIGDLDEIWNYNFARNVSNGLVPYKDFNMVITPLLSMICGLILKITMNELIIMRILSALLCASILFIIYKIFNKLNIKKEVSIIFTFFIGYLLKNCYCIDYNFASLLIVLFMIFIEIENYKKDNILIKANIKKDIFLGVLAGLTLTLKQTSGALICIVLLGNKLLFVRDKENLKIYFKSFLYRLIGVLVPVSILLIYLASNNATYDFISYTIKGVKGFSNYISYKSLIKFNLLGILAILVPLAIIYVWIKTVVKEKDKKEYFLLAYGLAIFIIAFPISNEIHFLIGATPIIILILYELYNILHILYKKLLYNKKKLLIGIMIFVDAIIIGYLLYFSITNFNKYLGSQNIYSELEHYKYIPISSSLQKQIKEVDNYIINSKEDVKMLDASAAVYMIPINIYNKDYDMINNGNLGENGEEKLINDIKESKNTKYLILNSKYRINWQTPMEIINFVKENKTKIAEISIFDVYE